MHGTKVVRHSVTSETWIQLAASGIMGVIHLWLQLFTSRTRMSASPKGGSQSGLWLLFKKSVHHGVVCSLCHTQCSEQLRLRWLHSVTFYGSSQLSYPYVTHLLTRTVTAVYVITRENKIKHAVSNSLLRVWQPLTIWSFLFLLLFIIQIFKCFIFKWSTRLRTWAVIKEHKHTLDTLRRNVVYTE